jgi:hypothetical protein
MKQRYWFLLVLVLMFGWDELFKLVLWLLTQGGHDYYLLLNSEGCGIARWFGCPLLTAWLMDRAGLLRGPSSS